MFLQIVAANETAGGGGFGYYLYGLIGLLIIFVAVVWIVFPFLVNAKFNELIREVRAMRGEMRGLKTEEPLSREATASQGKKSPPIPVPTPRQSEAATAPEVYRID